MKRTASPALLSVLLLTGRAAQTGPTNEELDWDKDWTRVGALLGAEPTDGFTLSENKDVMGICGLYYATWTADEARAALEGLFLRFLIFFGVLIWWAGTVTSGTLMILIDGILLYTMVFSVWRPQVALFDQSPAVQLKTASCFASAVFSEPQAHPCFTFWAVMVLLLPWTGFLVPFLGVWYILFAAVFLIYDQLNDAFRIEEQICAQFPEQIPVYENEEECPWSHWRKTALPSPKSCFMRGCCGSPGRAMIPL